MDDFMTLILGMVGIVALAAAVLTYVMFPHRNHRPRHGGWATEVMGGAADRVRPRGPVPVHGLWVDPEREEVFRHRMDNVERIVTVGLNRRSIRG